MHPLRDDWKKSVLLFLSLAGLLLIIHWSFASSAVTFISGFFLIASLYRYFLPFRYAFYEERLVVAAPFYRQEKPWSAFQSFYVDTNGVFLSPYSRLSRLENFRGLYVRFNRNRAEVEAFVKSKMSVAT